MSTIAHLEIKRTANIRESIWGLVATRTLFKPLELHPTLITIRTQTIYTRQLMSDRLCVPRFPS